MEDPWMAPTRLRSTFVAPLLLLPLLGGCATAGRVAVWTVKETVSVAADITRHTAKTTISLAADTAGYAAKKGIDTAFDVAGHALADEVVQEGVEQAVAREAKPVAAVLRKLLD